MKKQHKEALIAWVYILPSFLLIMVFVALPIMMSFYYSFTNYNVVQPAVWTGISNYTTLFKDTYIQKSFINTIVYTVLTVPAQTFLAIAIGVVIAEKFRGWFGDMIKSALFVPVISSAILVGTLWSLILATDNGIVNAMLNAVGLSSVNWLGSANTAMLSVCIVAVWKNVGYFLVIFYAGIMDIPRSYYEAAEVDGATKLQQFTKITLPCLKPITYLVVTLGVIWSFQVFDTVYAMTAGGPASSTMTLVYNIYQAGFREYRMGYASAIAIVLFALILIFNGIQKLFFKDND